MNKYSVLVAIMMIKNSLCAMPTSIVYQNCSYNETSFYEVYDDESIPWNLTRWSLKYNSSGGNQVFNAINNWTYIPGLGNYTNLQKG
jgi:hypothetical protein